MQLNHNLACYHLKGSAEGAKCGVVDLPIRSLEDGNIKLCLGRHHEACNLYRMSLHEECSTPSLQEMQPGIPGHTEE